MKNTFTFVLALLFAGALLLPASGANEVKPMPDLTNGGKIDHAASWTLGSTGARGWIFSNQRHNTEDSRQVYITEVAVGSPADGVLAVGDVILGVQGKSGQAVERFSMDARKEFAAAVTDAEEDANKGELRLIRWRASKEETVTLKLKVMGAFSETAPYNCPKTDKIIDTMVAGIMADGLNNGRTNLVDGAGIYTLMNALGLMAAGREDVMPIVEERMLQIAAEPVDGYKWGHAWSLLTLAEYYLKTKDERVLPAIRRYAMETANGQSIAGTWGHGFAGDDGVLGGYGAMNQVSIPHTIGMILAQKCGVKDEVVRKAIDKSHRFFSYYTGKGNVPYGAHEAGAQFGPDDNGKSSGVALFCNLLGDKKGASFLSRHGVYDYSRIEQGHASNFFHLPWQGMASAQLGEKAAAAHFRECRWYYELLRDWRGKVRFHEEPGATEDNKYWDATGARLLFLCLPRKQLYLTGKGGYVPDPLSQAEVDAIVESGRYDGKYDTLSDEQLTARLGDWCHATRWRAAQELAKREGDWCSVAMKMFAEGSMDQKYGALRMFEALKEKAEPAVDLLIKNLEDPDLWLRIRSAYCLEAIGAPAKKAVPALLKAVKYEDPQDNRNMFRRIITITLFDARKGLLKDKADLDAIPKDTLIPVLKLLLRGEEGQSVTCLANPLSNLSFEDLQPLWPEIVYRVEHRLSENVMFAHMQSACFDLLAEHKVEEGLDLVGYKMFTQNGWGGGGREDKTLNSLKKYGVHARRAFFPLGIYLQRNIAFNPKLQAFRKEIEAATDKPELRSITPYLGDYEIGSHFELLTTMRELRDKVEQKDLAGYWKVYEMCQELLEIKPGWKTSIQSLLDEMMTIPEAADIVAAHHAINKIKEAVIAGEMDSEKAIEEFAAYSKKYDIEAVGPNLVYWNSLMWGDKLKSGRSLK